MRFLLILLFSLKAIAADTFSIDKNTLSTVQKEYGEKAKNRILELINLLNDIQNKSVPDKLEAMNNFFNIVPYDTDLDIWKEKDYWATRTEFLSLDLGDCEDYVIAKYFSLRQLGIPDKNIFLTYVKAIKYKQSHMVLTYYENENSIPLVLDNINPKILPASQRDDLKPLFNFNGEKIYMAKQRGLGREVPQGKINLTQWSNLVLKIKKENP
jgi:predicted transglutaminase-like cysteine proteinase